MIFLLIDTSEEDVSIAILKDQKILSSITKTAPNDHSKYTVKMIDEAIKKAKITTHDIDKIMAVEGPGSFTGLRIGITIAKTFAYLEKIEIIPISSLKMRALSQSNNYCLSLIDAHHDNFYVGLYDNKYNEVIKEQFMNKNKVIELINKYHPAIISNKDGKIEEYSYKKIELNPLKIVEFYKDIPSINPHLVNPNYLKLPQALEEKKW